MFSGFVQSLHNICFPLFNYQPAAEDASLDEGLEESADEVIPFIIAIWILGQKTFHVSGTIPFPHNNVQGIEGRIMLLDLADQL